MSKITKAETTAIARLARLGLSEEKREELTKDLQKILDLFHVMDAVNVDDVEPFTHPTQMAQRLRKDTVIKETLLDAIQKNAPKAEGGLFLVPQVIE